MNERKNYRSCFITDVKITGDSSAVLTDSQRMTYYVDKEDMEASGFSKWLGRFLEGVAQTLTVFQYVDRGDDGDFRLCVVKFMNTKPARIDG